MKHGRSVEVRHAHSANLAVVRVRRRERYRTGLGEPHRLLSLEHVTGFRVQAHPHVRQTGRFKLDAMDVSPPELTGAHDADVVVVSAPVAEEHRGIPESRLRELLSCQLPGRRAAHSRQGATSVQYRPHLHRVVEIDVYSQLVVSGGGR
jgi:hypothetical protein